MGDTGKVMALVRPPVRAPVRVTGGTGWASVSSGPVGVSGATVTPIAHFGSTIFHQESIGVCVCAALSVQIPAITARANKLVKRMGHPLFSKRECTCLYIPC